MLKNDYVTILTSNHKHYGLRGIVTKILRLGITTLIEVDIEGERYFHNIKDLSE